MGKEATSSRPAKKLAPAKAPVDGETRGQIIEAARDVFAELGFGGARMRMIADRSKTNLGLLSYYFGTKEALWREVVDLDYQRLRDILMEAIESSRSVHGSDARRDVEVMLRTLVKHIARKPSHIRLMLDEIGRDADHTRWLVDRHVKPNVEFMKSIIEPAQAAGIMPDVPWPSLYYMIAGAVTLFFLQRPHCKIIMGVDPYDPDIAMQHEEAFISLFIKSVDEATI